MWYHRRMKTIDPRRLVRLARAAREAGLTAVTLHPNGELASFVLGPADGPQMSEEEMGPARPAARPRLPDRPSPQQLREYLGKGS